VDHERSRANQDHRPIPERELHHKRGFSRHSGDTRRRLSAARFGETRPGWFLSIGSGLLYSFLQTPLSAPVYRLVPPIQFIQFPWRLLAFSTPASIAILCLSLDLLERSAPLPSARIRLRAALLLAVAFQVFYGVGRAPAERILGVKEIEESLTTESLTATTVFSGAFRPRGVALPPPRPFLEATGCIVENVPEGASVPGGVDVPELRLTVSAGPEGVLVINQFANPFLTVSAGEAGFDETLFPRIAATPGIAKAVPVVQAVTSPRFGPRKPQ